MNGDSTDPMIGRLIDGRYQVRSRIARGGMATVYLATDLRLERRVAIKIMHGHLADDSQFKERFIQEARSAARLANPNVVNVFDQGQDSDMAYLVMEYLPGITLRDLLLEHGRLTSEQTLDVLEAVLSGLAAAHKAGIVHRDLKPENVLLADDGRIKIGDFGLARAASANTATGAALLGTIAYLSPELVTRGVADTRSDIYAVGIMMYEMLTGEQPFKGEQPMQIAYQHANDSVPMPSAKNPKVPAELDELVLWATARNPDERPRDARVMLEQLTATQTLLQSALPSKTTGSQRTIVLPVKAQSGSDDQTQVLGSTARHRTGPIASDSTTALSLRSNKRRTRGWWLFAVVVVLAALAGGTGWYFGTGPGAKISIPIVSGQSITQATRALVAQGFVVNDAQQKASDPVIAKGLVVGTVPAAGTAVAKGGALTLVISQGPAMLAVPALVGLPEAEATATITTSKFTAGTPIQQFDSTVASGVVIDALDANGKTLVGRKTYGERQPITLVVSVGKLPAVSGMSLSDAQSALTAAKLTGVEGAHLYSSTIKQGQVIGIDQEKNAQGVARTFRVNDTVLLTISRGPELITVPNVVGMTWAQAKKILTDAHFVVSYNPAADAAPNFAIVKKTNPMGGKQAPKGSTITVTFLGG